MEWKIDGLSILIGIPPLSTINQWMGSIRIPYLDTTRWYHIKSETKYIKYKFIFFYLFGKLSRKSPSPTIEISRAPQFKSPAKSRNSDDPDKNEKWIPMLVTAVHSKIKHKKYVILIVWRYEFTNSLYYYISSGCILLIFPFSFSTRLMISSVFTTDFVVLSLLPTR